MNIEYLCSKNTSLLYEESGVAEKIKIAYIEMLNGRNAKYLPMNTQIVPVKAGEIIIVSYTEPVEIDIPIQIWFKHADKMWKSITWRNIEIVIGHTKFNGEVIAYDSSVPTLSFLESDLKILRKSQT